MCARQGPKITVQAFPSPEYEQAEQGGDNRIPELSSSAGVNNECPSPGRSEVQHEGKGCKSMSRQGFTICSLFPGCVQDFSLLSEKNFNVLFFLVNGHLVTFL